MVIFTYQKWKRYVITGAILFLLLPGAQFQVKSQVIFSETFNNTAFPSGWTIDQQPQNWIISPDNSAGGTPSELKFTYSPVFFNYSRIISPPIDLSSALLANMEFKYSIDHIYPGYTFGLLARNGDSPWTMLWSTVPVNSINATTQSVVIHFPGFNTADFQFAFFYQGNSANIIAINIDDIKISLPPLHDIAVKEIITPYIQVPNVNLIPEVTVMNAGQSTEYFFTAVCRIYDGNNNLISNNQVIINQLEANQTDTVSFPPVNLAFANDYYRIESFILLGDDLNPSNDTLNKTIKTLTLVNRKFVLTEMATATWCVSCPATTQAIHDLLVNGKQMAVAEYHSPNGDIYTNGYSSQRLDYYNVPGYPMGIFDGVLTYIGSPNAFDEYQMLYDQRMNVLTPYDLKIYGTHNGNQYNLNIVLYRMAPVNNAHIVLRVILTESSISYNWLGQTQLDHVVRMMIPDAEGTPVNLVNNTVMNIPLSFTMATAWNPVNCEIIAFLQDTVTKEVYQVNKRTYAELVPMGFQKIQGYVKYRNASNTPLQGVTVKLRLGGGIVATTTTLANGYYSFTGIPPGTYYLSCLAAAPWGGVNAADALKIMNYFAGIESLDPLQFKAADNDVSNFINTTDALNVMKRFVGISGKFNQADWVFDSPVINLPNSTIVNQNIKGLCTGDINGSYIP